MDRIDNEILTLLLKNARISLSEISSQVNLSVSAVRERLKKLENSEMIQQYTMILDPKAFHKDLTVIMLVTLSHFSENCRVHRVCSLSEPSITEYYYIAGSYHCCLKIITEDTASFEKIFNQIRSFPCVGKTQSNVVLSPLKCTHSIMPPVVD